jgi:hypothetical protein
MLDKIISAIDRWFEVWIVAIAIITGAWVLYRIVEFLIY